VGHQHTSRSFIANLKFGFGIFRSVRCALILRTGPLLSYTPSSGSMQIELARQLVVWG
jgi:hypothetical protein